MLNLSVKVGEYLMVGDNVKIILVGGTGNNVHLMIDAPREVSIVRSKAAEKAGKVAPQSYGRKKPPVSEEAQQEIIRIIREDRKKKNTPAKAERDC